MPYVFASFKSDRNLCAAAIKFGLFVRLYVRIKEFR
jgi:hypothetical protein